MWSEIERVIIRSIKKNFTWFHAAFITAVWFGLYFMLVTPVFANNDDFYLHELAAGRVTGTPEARLYFFHIFYGLLLKISYTFFPTLPWYGIFFLGVEVLSVFFFVRFLGHEIWGHWIVFPTFLCAGWAVLFRHFASLQFTTVSCIAAVGGLFCFLESDWNRSIKQFLLQNMGTFFLLGVSYSIREMSALMILPFGFVLFLFQLWRYRRGSKIGKKAVAFLLASAGVLAVLFVSQKLAYSGEEWEEYSRYSENRAKIHDYAGYPDYDTYQAVYDKYGISKESKEVASGRYLMVLDKAINADSLEELAGISQENREVSSDFPSFLIESIKARDGRPLSLLVPVLYLVVLLAMLKKWDFYGLWGTSLLLCAGLFLRALLFWNGRYPLRVTQGLYLAEFFILLAIACLRAKYSLPALILMLLLWRTGPEMIREIQWDNIGRIQFGEAYTEWEAYCTKQDEILFCEDVMSFSYFTKPALMREKEGAGNQLLLGGWLSGSPWNRKVLDAFHITDLEEALVSGEGVRLVCMDTEETKPDYIQTYYESKGYGIRLEQTDSVKTQNGVVFLIYKVKN